VLPFTQTVDELSAGRDALVRGRYGVIETMGGEFSRVLLRPLPKLVSWPEVWPVRLRFHGKGPEDRCRLYYNQPCGMSNFLALRYIVSTEGTSFKTFRAALTVLDAIAEMKRTDAIVCDAGNLRLSDRIMNRLGWEAHKPQRWHRNFIRRFYGKYPSSLGV